MGLGLPDSQAAAADDDVVTVLAAHLHARQTHLTWPYSVQMCKNHCQQTHPKHQHKC